MNNEHKTLEERNQMTSLEATIATELENSGTRMISDDGRINAEFSHTIQSYINLMEECYRKTPTNQNPNVYGYNTINIKDETQKAEETGKLKQLWVWGLADGSKYARAIKKIEYLTNTPSGFRVINTVDISDFSNLYNTYILTEKGTKLFEEHKKQSLTQ